MITMLLILISTYPWPMRPFDSAHGVSATLGDARGSVADPRFHRGIDIPATNGTDVFSITSTDSAIAPIGYDYVRVGDYYYDHLTNRIDEGDSVTGILDTTTTSPTQIGDVMDYGTPGPAGDHLHFQVGPAGGPFENPLSHDDGPVGYDDTGAPSISSVDFWRQGSEEATAQQLDSILDGKVDIRARCQDTQTSGGVNNTSGIHKLEWLVTDTTGSDTLTIAQTITFPQVQPPNNGDSVLLVYDRHNYTTYSPFYYWATNPIVNDQVEDRYWNTKRQEGEPDSVDADSIEVAKFKDGYYWVKIYAYDISDRADSESVYVHVDNFSPKVKIAYPTDHYHHIEKYEK
ncbi:hypothetical protein IBX73_09915, partial [candidate division WOR-3 bacterium]|nr:hypothetical protein [candidate division WOR-3 bacterium]